LAGRTAIGIRAAHLLCKASLIALGSSILVQPAMAQATAATNEQGKRAADAASDIAPSTPRVAANPAVKSTVEPAGEEIRITGSRIITTNLKSPTPVTAVSTAELAKTTPSDIPDALNKLPQLIGGNTPRSQGNGSFNNGANTLSLRNFGPQRTLILLNGHRVPPTNQNGTVDIDTLPQMMVSRVEIVTGGASAIYGSDAVAGVVNFILDKKFTGLLVKGDVGISKYGDGKEGQIGVAWGTDLFGGRGHFETSARYRRQARIPMNARPYGANGQAWLLTGNGKPNNPFTNTPYGRVINAAELGTITCQAPGAAVCPVNGYTFNSPGLPSPLVHGTPTGSTNLESGGDGGWVPFGTFRSGVDMKEWFGRFSYDVTDHINAYVQGSWADSRDRSNWINWVVSPSANRPNTLFANNPFLPSSTQALLGANVVCGTPAAVGWLCLPPVPATSPQTGTTPPPPPSTPYFKDPSSVWNKIGGEDVDKNNRLYRTEGDTRNIDLEAGLTGALGSFDWDVFYSHGEARTKVVNPNNTDNAKYLASLDAVIAPPGTKVNGTDVSGSIVCWVTTQPQFASLYPGCVPTNITDPNGPSLSSFNYLRTATWWVLTQKLDNIGGSIGGDIGFGLPAGHIKANISGDARWATFKMDSNFRPTDFVDCTGLRMCLANGGAPVRWVQNTNAPVDARNNVYEGAGELYVPLIKDAPLVQDLSVDVAGRYTKYSTFKAVKTWKAGANWHVNGSIAFRATASLDIRAPNLNELYQPAGVSSTGFLDRLTGGSNSLRLISKGNPNLTPEKARTITLGTILTPTFIPGFSVTVDYYRTRMKDAITNISYQSDTIQGLCLASAPTYDSPLCGLAIRPITNPSDPNYKDPILNFPTAILSSPINVARQWTEGVEVEANYGFDVRRLFPSWAGHVRLRHLLSYQPVNSSLTLPNSTFPVWAVQPKVRQSTFFSYDNNLWSLALQNTYLGRVRLATSDNTLMCPGTPPAGPAPCNGNSQNYAKPFLKAFDTVDATVTVHLRLAGANTDAFLNVTNLFNARAPLFPSNSGIPGLFYPTLGFHDDMGRFFTAGFRARF
jgi:outer membrane receptor protein involved in Fe transport